MLKVQKQDGFAHTILILAMLVILVISFAGYRVATNSKNNKDSNTQNTQLNATKDSWEYDGSAWNPTGNPPKCSTPLLNRSPVDIKTVTAILYPGQVRGQYKAHGGFHFRNNATNDVRVVMPIDGKITSAVRYYQTGDNGVNELQYLVTFLNDCGVSIKFDHLLTLSPEVQSIMDRQPAAKLNDTGSLPLKGGELFKEGAVIATAVGQKSNVSVGMDFGVYDYRKKNAASKDSAYAEAHKTASYADFYATCWLNDLPVTDSVIAKSLPGGDGKMGTTSDYCK